MYRWKSKRLYLKIKKVSPPLPCIRHERVVQNVISKVEKEQSTPYVTITESHQDDICKSYSLTPHYKGKYGEKNAL